MMILLIVLLGLSITANSLQAYLNQRTNEKWMRMFSLDRGIPLPNVIEAKPEVKAPAKPKLRFSIPIPGGEMFKRKVQ